MEVDKGICTLTLNRPDKFNSFIRQMALDLQNCLDTCAEDENIRCIVLIGAGRAFCAGQDLKEAMEAKGDGLKRIVGEHYNPIIQKIVDMPKPVLAAVNGVAAGAGANIALACDIVIATASASFIQAFSKIGLIPDSAGTYTLPRLVGYARATALMMTGEKVAAREAEEMGMIYKAVEDESFQEAVEKLSQRLAAMPTMALALTKKALRESMKNDIYEQSALEEKLQYKASQTHDYAEGVAAFLEKRPANFKGK